MSSWAARFARLVLQTLLQPLLLYPPLELPCQGLLLLPQMWKGKIVLVALEMGAAALGPATGTHFIVTRAMTTPYACCGCGGRRGHFRC